MSKSATCPTCGGGGIVDACAIVACVRHSIGRCIMCRAEVCAQHGGDLYGTILCHVCFRVATMLDIHEARKA